ncbi:MAG: hypothetical protein KDB03_13915 [Planctomycetales bacterium]|nr:hypothetical protein [Planctomycetales bacterium]
MRLIYCLLAPLLAAILNPLPLLAQFPTAELSSLSPPVLQIGRESNLQAAGRFLDESMLMLIDSPGAIVEPVLSPASAIMPKADVDRVTGLFRVRVDAGAEPGVFEVRVGGRHGISNSRKLLLVHSPCRLIDGDLGSPALAFPLAPGTVYCRFPQPQAAEHFAIALEAGDQVRVVAYSQQLDSRARLTMSLSAPSRLEVAAGRTIDAWPAEIDWQAEESGDYQLVIHDALFQGTNEYGYVLEVAVQRAGSESKPTPELDQLLRPVIDERGMDARIQNVSRAQSDIPRPPCPHGTVNESRVHQPPFSVDGNLCPSANHELDFVARQGESWSVDIRSQQLEQLTDPQLLVYQIKENGELKQVAEQDDRVANWPAAMKMRGLDPLLEWKVPEDGRYRFTLRDNQQGPRPADSMAVQVLCEASVPTFSSLAYSLFPSNNAAASRGLGVHLMRGGTQAIHVLAVRRCGHQSPIEISVVGLPDGVKAYPATIPSGSNECVVVLQAAEDSVAWTGPISMIATDMTTHQSQGVASGEVVWGSVPTNNRIISRLTDHIHLQISEIDSAPVTIDFGDIGNKGLNDEKIHFSAAQGSKLSLPIKLVRRDTGKVNCVLRPQNLPPKTTLPEVTIAADKDEGAMELNVPNDAPLGTYTLWLQCEMRVRWASNPQRLQRSEERLMKLKNATAANFGISEEQFAAAIKAAEGDVEAAKASAAAADITVWVPSNSLTVQIVAPSN